MLHQSQIYLQEEQAQCDGLNARRYQSKYGGRFPISVLITIVWQYLESSTCMGGICNIFEQAMASVIKLLRNVRSGLIPKMHSPLVCSLGCRSVIEPWFPQTQPITPPPHHFYPWVPGMVVNNCWTKIFSWGILSVPNARRKGCLDV